jgi:hypothetical protein
MLIRLRWSGRRVKQDPNNGIADLSELFRGDYRVARSLGFALLGESLLAVAGWPAPPKGTKRSCPYIRTRRPRFAALDFPHSIRAPGAGVQGPSMALYASRGIHAARSPPRGFHSAF